jgi:hypothetical protein
MTEYRTRAAVRVFDPVDLLARVRGLAGTRPRPIGALRVFLLADHTPGAERSYERPPELILGQDTQGYVISHGKLRDARGRVSGGGFGGGPYSLRVNAEHYQVAEFTGVRIPASAEQPEPFELPLRPAYSYPFPRAVAPPVVELTGSTPRSLSLLRGSVLAPQGTGVADAEVTAPGAFPYRTDTDGEWALVFPEGAPGPVDVTITVPDSPPVVLTGIVLTPGGTTSLAQTALRGRVRAPGVDPRTATVRVMGSPGTAGIRADGGWTYCFPPDHQTGEATVAAALPDGRTLTVTAAVTPRRTNTVPEFRFPEMRSSDA